MALRPALKTPDSAPVTADFFHLKNALKATQNDDSAPVIAAQSVAPVALYVAVVNSIELTMQLAAYPSDLFHHPTALALSPAPGSQLRADPYLPAEPPTATLPGDAL